jgi:hypothetical protein
MSFLYAITVPHKLDGVKIFLGYNYGIMLKYLAGLVLILGMAAFVARQDERAAEQHAQKAAQHHETTSAAKSDEQHSDSDISKTEWDTPSWYGFFRWPNGSTALAILLTLMAIAEQTKQTTRAAKGTEDAVKAAKFSYNLARDTSERELRAYLTVFNARLFLYEDGSIEPRLTISNSGQTPAYEFRGIQALSLNRTLVHPTTPSDDFLLRYGTVGRDYWLTGEMRKVGTNKQQVIDYLLSGDMHVILYGWYKYQDVFGHTHPLDFRLVVSQRGTLSKGQDSENEWLVFFDDWEAIPAEHQQKNPN